MATDLLKPEVDRWISAACPKCSSIIEVEGDWPGHSIQCETCQTSVHLPQGEEPKLARKKCQWCGTEASFWGYKRSSQIWCPSCRAAIGKVDDATAGPRRVKVTEAPPDWAWQPSQDLKAATSRISLPSPLPPPRANLPAASPVPVPKPAPPAPPAPAPVVAAPAPPRPAAPAPPKQVEASQPMLASASDLIRLANAAESTVATPARSVTPAVQLPAKQVTARPEVTLPPSRRNETVPPLVENKAPAINPRKTQRLTLGESEQTSATPPAFVPMKASTPPPPIPQPIFQVSSTPPAPPVQPVQPDLGKQNQSPAKPAPETKAPSVFSTPAPTPVTQQPVNGHASKPAPAAPKVPPPKGPPAVIPLGPVSITVPRMDAPLPAPTLPAPTLLKSSSNASDTPAKTRLPQRVIEGRESKAVKPVIFPLEELSGKEGDFSTVSMRMTDDGPVDRGGKARPKSLPKPADLSLSPQPEEEKPREVAAPEPASLWSESPAEEPRVEDAIDSVTPFEEIKGLLDAKPVEETSVEEPAVEENSSPTQETVQPVVQESLDEAPAEPPTPWPLSVFSTPPVQVSAAQKEEMEFESASRFAKESSEARSAFSSVLDRISSALDPNFKPAPPPPEPAPARIEMESKPTVSEAVQPAAVAKKENPAIPFRPAPASEPVIPKKKGKGLTELVSALVMGGGNPPPPTPEALKKTQPVPLSEPIPVKVVESPQPPTPKPALFQADASNIQKNTLSAMSPVRVVPAATPVEEVQPPPVPPSVMVKVVQPPPTLPPRAMLAVPTVPRVVPPPVPTPAAPVEPPVAAVSDPEPENLKSLFQKGPIAHPVVEAQAPFPIQPRAKAHAQPIPVRKPERASKPSFFGAKGLVLDKKQQALVGLGVIALLALSGFTAFYLVRNHQVRSAGFKHWQDYDLYEQAQKLAVAGQLDAALAKVRPRASNSASDPGLKAYYFPLRARLGKEPLSLTEVGTLIKGGEKGVDTAGIALLWEAAWQGPESVRMDAIELLLELSIKGEVDATQTAATLGVTPESILGSRATGLAGYQWDCSAARWYRLKAQTGDNSAKDMLISWMSTEEPNRIRREMACLNLLQLGDASAAAVAKTLFADITPAITFRRDQAKKMWAEMGADVSPLERESVRSWATNDLGKTIARTYAVLYSKAGDPTAVPLLADASTSGSLYGELAAASAAEIASVLGEQAKASLKAAKEHWKDDLAKLKVEGGTSPSEENMAFQRIANTALQAIDLEMGRVGDAAERDRMELELERAGEFEKVRLALLWGSHEIDTALPVLNQMVVGEKGLTVSPQEREQALKCLLKYAGEESKPVLVQALTRENADIRYRSAIRLVKLALLPEIKRS